MRVTCHIGRSLVLAVLTTFVGAGGVGATSRVTAEAGLDQDTVQGLFERGALREAVARAGTERDNVESTYFAAHAYAQMDNVDGARDQYTHLRDTGDASWKAIGESGLAYIGGNLAAAMQAATRAVAANGENAYAHYQVGVVSARQNDFKRAAEAFSRSATLKPDFAYAHYYAGLANQRLRQVPQMSEHFEAFLRLAPDAPERGAIMAILRTLRG
ncbi:MAG: hypothetical protein ACT4QD_17635 [Acidobacteriota bacterium]